MIYEVTNIDELVDLEKSFGRKDMAKLVKKQITNKKGHKQTVWVKQGETMDKIETKNRPDSQLDNEKRNKTPYTVGDTIQFNLGANTLNGKIAGVFHEGVVVSDSKNNRYKVPYKNIKRITDKAPDITKTYTKDFRDGTDGKQPEGCDTLDGLQSMCEAVQEEFKRKSNEIINRFKKLNPELLTRSELKGNDRIKEKLREDEKTEVEKGQTPGEIYDAKTDTYHCRTIRDKDGHTYVMESKADVMKVLEYLGTRQDMIRIKNNFAQPSPLGYTDCNINIRLSNGTVAEIQLNTAANMVAKERYGYALYEVSRAIDSNPEYSELKTIVSEAQRKLYGMSNELSSNGNFPHVKNVFSADYKPYGDEIKPYLQKAKELFNQAKNSNAFNEKTVKHFEELCKRLGV